MSYIKKSEQLQRDESMNFDKYTIKSQEVIQNAAELASGNQQQAIEPGHILKAVLHTDENVSSFLVKKLNINQELLEIRLEEIISKYPKVSGQQPYFSNVSASVLQHAEKILKDFGDEYIAVEHIILGILSGNNDTAQLMKDLGFEKESLIKAIKELRGGGKVTDPNAESKYKSKRPK